MKIKNDHVANVTDPLALEDLQLQCYISMDYGLKQLGYKFERLEDQHFENYDCYTVAATSPLGRKLLNFYDKKTGDLLMTIYPNQHRSVFIAYYESGGVRMPSQILMTDTSAADVTRSLLTKLNYNRQLDEGWFTLPPAGFYMAPATFKTGSFKYVGSNENAVIDRTPTTQIETNGAVKTSFSITWLSNGDYLLYSSATNAAEVKAYGYFRVHMIGWSGRKYYCHYITENNVGGTCVFEKIK